MRRRSLTSPEPEISEINVSPMIDMVFILLIFFIVTAVFVQEPGVEVRRPLAISAHNLEKNSILIAITEADQVVYGGREIGISGIRPIVRRFNNKSAMPVIIQADERASASLVVRVVDEAKLGGSPTVSIATEF